MAQTVIAKCENCGAALRVSEAAGGTVTCEYCGTESMVGAAPGAGGAPTVRIDKAPRPQFSDGIEAAANQLGGKYALVAASAFVLALLVGSDVAGHFGLVGGAPNALWMYVGAVGWTLLACRSVWLSRKKLTRAKAQAKQREDEYQWFREALVHGSGQDHSCRLPICVIRKPALTEASRASSFG